jgi:hypothetical protein
VENGMYTLGVENGKIGYTLWERGVAKLSVHPG